MQPIQPTGAFNTPRPTQMQAGLANAQQVSAGVQTTNATATSSVTNISMVNQQIGQALGNIDSRLASNEALKLLLAIIILNALLAEDGGTQQSGQAALKALEDFAGGRGNAMYITIETSTNTVQLQQQSIRLDSVEAAQSLWRGGEQNGGSGQRIDMAG